MIVKKLRFRFVPFPCRVSFACGLPCIHEAECDTDTLRRTESDGILYSFLTDKHPRCDSSKIYIVYLDICRSYKVFIF